MNQPREANANHQVIGELTRGLRLLLTLIRMRLIEQREDTITLATLKVEIAQLRERLDGLASVVREGNGQDPLTTRLALAEAALADLQDHHRQANQARHAHDQHKVAGEWQVRVAIVTGVFGLVTALIALFK